MKLAEVRKSKGLSQRALCDLAGVGIKALQAYEQGYRDINTSQAITLYKLAQALECSMEDLLELDDK